MAKRWDTPRRIWDSHDDYYNESVTGYGWLVRTAAAAIIFFIVYATHVSGTFLGKWVDSGITSLMTSETDLVYVAEQTKRMFDSLANIPALQKVQLTMSKPADPLIYMSKPTEGKLVTSYGWHTNPATHQQSFCEGIEIEVGNEGGAVKAAAAGRVQGISESEKSGKVVIVEHGSGVQTTYGKVDSILVKENDLVSQGQVIALINKQGNKSPAKLYFELKVEGKAEDPLSRIRGEFSAK